MQKRVLVTGGAGFLGSHLCEQLLQRGCKVLCLDNFLTGREINIESFQNHPRFTLIQHDICIPLQLEIDEIYNLACPASPIQYQCDPVKTVRTCVQGALHMLELAHNCQAKILQASTSEVYGDPTIHPQEESYFGNVNPVGPRSCYDEGKRCAETLFFDYHRQYNLRIKIARIFNTYGPCMHLQDGRVVSNFIVQALKNDPITIYGNGQQTRSLCYVDDLIEGLIAYMQTPDHIPGPMNLGNPEEYTIQQIAELIIALTGSRSPITYRAPLQDDPKQRCPDISLAKKTLNWHPKVSVREGLLQTIIYFEKQLQKLHR